jgi:myo-inositol-1(or 4)-monophosphatase
MSMSKINVREVCDWARTGGDIARSYFNSVTGKRKPDQTLVSQADVEIEEFLRDRIRDHYPDHGVIGEEQGGDNTDREFVWSLDPLDGTEAFLVGLPIWGVSIGILRHGRPYLGVIYLPMTDGCYWNDLDGRAYRNGKTIRTSQATRMEAKDWLAVPSNAHLSYDIIFPNKTRSLGSIVAHFCYVARGDTAGSLIGYPHLWDIAAGMAILQAAGGITVTLPDGEALDTRPLLNGGKTEQPVIACAPALMPDMLQSIRERRET